MDAEEAPAGPQRPGQRGGDRAALNPRAARAVGLGGRRGRNRPAPALARDDLIEQETEILAIDDERGGALRWLPVLGLFCARQTLARNGWSAWICR